MRKAQAVSSIPEGWYPRHEFEAMLSRKFRPVQTSRMWLVARGPPCRQLAGLVLLIFCPLFGGMTSANKAPRDGREGGGVASIRFQDEGNTRLNKNLYRCEARVAATDMIKEKLLRAFLAPLYTKQAYSVFDLRAYFVTSCRKVPRPRTDSEKQTPLKVKLGSEDKKRRRRAVVLATESRTSDGCASPDFGNHFRRSLPSFDHQTVRVL